MANKQQKKTDPQKNADRRVLVSNRKARHDYEILDTIEAGIELVGTEVKSIRDGKVNLGDSYAAIEQGQAWLISMHVSPFPQANQFNHEPLRKRRLLLHRRQIDKLEQRVQEKGFTLIPLAVTLVKNRVKIDIGVCRGKKLYDKRESTKERDARREMDRARREAQR
ncbi:MAG: SsrA-binding protein SmpB [Candidatus Eisenbacteria bacterium]|uniref:SsrA-binding protein n=1 Tax=Eiseniibacteriota bacterium TaxID=2212470 RepID=A0A956SHN7_UNCEI|nr:SsrA-binding protein SmpB [Candidatus Eisenbacteria bacterium]MCB9462130.1 SsrA-binding protein SmpB [Candidatus Eisenbacteria bacterium]